jgi:hypothetical protein
VAEFFICQHTLQHAVHGTFYLTRLSEDSTWEVTRVYKSPGDTENTVERIAPWGERRTLAQAKRIVRKRIAEIEAERCGDCGAQLVHVAGSKVSALLCTECNHDSSALDDDDEPMAEDRFTNARIVDQTGSDV